MQATESHPNVEELTAFAQGTLEEDSLLAIEGHLSGCPECQSKAANAPDDRLIGLLRSVHSRATGCDTLTPASTDTVTHPPQLGEGVPESLAHLERYRVFRLLGRGGMGEVYQAEHRLMHRTVAMKVIKREFTSSAARVERFRREARVAARLSHPNIVHAYDADHSGETHFLVMEYVVGRTLGKLVAEGGPLPIDKACDYVRQAALGLQHAHEQGLVHRDIKPDNLILADDGRVKVLDFGLASLAAEANDSLTEENVVMGTPDFMAPEQAEDAHSSDIRADIYSLGCTLYFLLTGVDSGQGTTPVRKLYAHRDKPVPSVRKRRSEVPAELAAIVSEMMAKKPKDRYQTPGEVAEALASYRAGKKAARWPGWLVAAGLLLAVSVVGVGLATYSIKSDRGELVMTTEDEDVVKEKPAPAEAKEVFRRRDVRNVNCSLDISRNGKYLLSGHWRRSRIWDASTGKIMHRLDGWVASFTSDGKRVLVLSNDSKHLKLYDTATGKHLRDLAHHAKPLLGFHALPNARLVQTATGDKEWWQWDIETGKVTKSSPNDDSPEFWGGLHEEVHRCNRLSGNFIDYILPNGREGMGRNLVDGRFVAVYDFNTGKIARKIELEAKGRVEVVANTGRYGRRLGERMALASSDGTIYVVDLTAGAVVCRLVAKNFTPRMLAISADDRFVAACGGHNQKTDLVIWRLPDPPAKQKR